MNFTSTSGTFHVVESPHPFQSSGNVYSGPIPASSLSFKARSNALNPNAVPFQCSSFSAAPVETATSPSFAASSTPSAGGGGTASAAVPSPLPSPGRERGSTPTVNVVPQPLSRTSEVTASPTPSPMMMMMNTPSGAEMTAGGNITSEGKNSGTMMFPPTLQPPVASPFLSSPFPSNNQYPVFSQGSPMMMMMMNPMGTGGVTPVAGGGGNGKDVFMVSSPSPPLPYSSSAPTPGTPFLSPSPSSFGTVGVGLGAGGMTMMSGNPAFAFAPTPIPVHQQQQQQLHRGSGDGSTISPYGQLVMNLAGSPLLQQQHYHQHQQQQKQQQHEQQQHQQPSWLFFGSPGQVPVGCGNIRDAGGAYVAQTVLTPSSVHLQQQPPRHQTSSIDTTTSTASSSSSSAPPSGMMLMPNSSNGMMMMVVPTRNSVASSSVSSSSPGPTPIVANSSDPLPVITSSPLTTTSSSSTEPTATTSSDPASASSFSPRLSTPIPSQDAPSPTSLPPSSLSGPSLPCLQLPIYTPGDELQALALLPYKSSMLPPPLSIERHQKVWRKNFEGRKSNDAEEDVKEEREDNTEREEGKEAVVVAATVAPVSDKNESETVEAPHGKQELDNTTAGAMPHGQDETLSRKNKNEEETHLEERKDEGKRGELEPHEEMEGKKKGKEVKHLEMYGKEHRSEASTTEVSTLSTERTSIATEERTREGELAHKTVQEGESHQSSSRQQQQQEERQQSVESPEKTKTLDQNSSGITDSAKSNCTSQNVESPEEKSQRLLEYKLILDRWFSHIEVLQEKPDVAVPLAPKNGALFSFASSNRHGSRSRVRMHCKSYEDVLQQYRQSSATTHATKCNNNITTSTSQAGLFGKLGGNVLSNTPCSTPPVSLSPLSIDEHEEVLQCWSDECVKWWESTQKKRSRRQRRSKRGEDLFGSGNGSRSAVENSFAAALTEAKGENGKTTLRMPRDGEEKGMTMMTTATSVDSRNHFPPTITVSSAEKDESPFSSVRGTFTNEKVHQRRPDDRCDVFADRTSPRYPQTTTSESSSELQFDEDSCRNWGLTDAVASELLFQLDFNNEF